MGFGQLATFFLILLYKNAFFNKNIEKKVGFWPRSPQTRMVKPFARGHFSKKNDQMATFFDQMAIFGQFLVNFLHDHLQIFDQLLTIFDQLVTFLAKLAIFKNKSGHGFDQLLTTKHKNCTSFDPKTSPKISIQNLFKQDSRARVFTQFHELLRSQNLSLRFLFRAFLQPKFRLK